MKGLVLEGGGVKGAYHIGVLTALREEGLDNFDGYVGTSIGAINSAMLAAGDWEKTLYMWQNVNLNNVLNMDENTLKRVFKGRFDIELLGDVGKIFTNIGGFIDTTTDKMRAYFKAFINEEAVRLSNKDFGLVTYSVPDFTPHYMMKEDIPEGKLYDYVMASAAYPTFRWQRIEGSEEKWFIDGGVYDNMPVNMLLDRGYDELVVIRTNLKKYRRKIHPTDAKITYFTPSEKLDFAISFTKENVDKYLEMGYYEAKRVLRGLSGVRYCVDDRYETELEEFLDTLDRDVVAGIVKTAGMKPHKSHDANIEDVRDYLAQTMELAADTPDRVVFVQFLEAFAILFKVNRFHFYKLSEFYDKIMFAAHEVDKTEPEGLDAYLKRNRSVKSGLKKVFYPLYANFNFGNENE